MKKGLLFTLLMFAFCVANAQLTGWQYVLPITINNTGAALTNYQIKFSVWTSQYVSTGKMNWQGADIRFATDGCGTNLLPYYIESDMNSTGTKIWVKVDNLPANATRKIYMFFGNPSAAGVSSITATFNGPYSATNQTTGGTSTSSPNSQYGFRFSPNQDILVTSFGKYEPTGSTRYLSLFNYSSQALLRQVQVSGVASDYSYTNTTPMWLTQGTEYLMEMYNGTTDDHYQGTAASLNTALTFIDTRYCHSCTQNTFPTGSVANNLYGYPDFQFYTRTPATVTPTYTFGTMETPVTSQTPSVDITASPSGNVCPGTNITFTATPTNGGSTPAYQWKVNGSNVGTNSTTYSSATLVAGDVVSCVMTSSLTCLTQPTATDETPALVRRQPVIGQEPVNKVHCIGDNTFFKVKTPGLDLSYQWQVNTGGGFADLADNTVYTGSNTDSLSITATTLGMHNYEYRCIVSGMCGFTNDTSVAAVLSVYIHTVVDTEPPATRVQCPATNTTLAVAASGGLLTYQWQVNTGSGYSNITNNSVYSGATTNSLGMTGLTVSMNGYKYRCIVKGGCGNDTSIVTDLTVYTVTGITTQPADKKPCVGTTVNFAVATNGSNLTYQWQINTGSGFTPLSNGGAYAGVDQATLTVSNTTLAMDNNKFRCVVTGSCGTETSAEAKLNVTAQPVINITSPATSVCANLSLQFTATATDAGTPPNYQWKKNGTNVGTNSTTYTASGLQTNDVITCELGVTSLCPAVPTLTSNSITVTQIPTIPTSVTISSQYGANSCIGLPVTFTATPVNPGTAPVYQWKKNSVNVGTNSPVYTTTGIVNGDVITCQLSSSVVCPDPVVASSNTFNMTLYPVLPATVTLTVTPDSVECAGNAITFNSHFTNGGANPQYQWQLNGADIPGATQPTYTSNSLNDNDLVACVFSSSTYCIFPVTSTPVKVDITQPVTPSVSIWGWPVSGGVRFTADIVNGGNNPVIQWRKNGKDIPGETGTTYDAIGIKQDDVITAYLVSSIECTTSPAAISNGLTIMKVTGIKNVTGAFSELNLFPNPNKGSFTVRGTLSEAVSNPDAKVEVVNAIGQVVYANTARIEGREINLDVNMNGVYAAGMYTVRLVVDGNVSNIRFVIKD